MRWQGGAPDVGGLSDRDPPSHYIITRPFFDDKEDADTSLWQKPVSSTNNRHHLHQVSELSTDIPLLSHDENPSHASNASRDIARRQVWGRNKDRVSTLDITGSGFA